VTHSLLLVTHGLVANQDGLTLHPDLLLWQDFLAKRKRQWFDCVSKNPLAMYAALQDIEPALLLASKLSLSQSQQAWVASPYHAKLSRDAVRVMPEGMLHWSEDDAIWACETLNPLFAEEGMKLHNIGAALLLLCDTAWHAYPATFAEIAGKSLPNRHPSGEDGGSLMRLMAEVQMMFKQSPAAHRRQRGEEDVHGLWFWGGCEVSEKEVSAKTSNSSRVNQCFHSQGLATRNPFLQSLVDGRNAKVMIAEPEELADMISQDKHLPKHVALLGEGFAVVLKPSLLPCFRKKSWLPVNVKIEAELLLNLVI